MKIRVERDTLADAVAWAARTLPSRPSLPVLAGLVLTAEGDSLTLSSFDYEVSARVAISADIEVPGTTLVSGRLLADIARSLPGAPVTLVSEGTRIVISCGRSSFTLPTLPVEDYPQLPAMPQSSGEINAAVFAEAVAQVAIAAGKDDTLPTLTGIRMEIEGQSITLAATDRYRLAVRNFTWSPATSSISTQALIPARTLAETAKALANAEGVTLALAQAGEGLIGFEGNGRRTTTRLLDGEFPKYRSLLPSESTGLATIEIAALADAVKRVALVAERNTPVRLAFEGSEVILRAGAGEDAQANEAVESVLEGDDIEIAFNPTYLLDGLAALDAPYVRMSFTQSTRPAVLTGAADPSSELRDDYRYLLMPVRLTG
ncbi:MAG: DNA polymerase III subunit beta [Candidatus Nanopelagicales bacterium]|nr:DNA polymerase III subunit beta [Candidatus Nanopelagicales bacterium]